MAQTPKDRITALEVEASEEWRAVRGYPGFEASSFGRVRSTLRGGAPVVLKQRTHSSRGRYLATCVRAGKKWQNCLVHHLVALAFLGCPPGPCGRGRSDWQVNHIDGDRQNNRPSNLEWLTHAENHRHASQAGLLAVGEKHGLTTLTENEVRRIRAEYAEGFASQDAIGRRYGVTQTTVGRIVRRATWRHVA